MLYFISIDPKTGRRVLWASLNPSDSGFYSVDNFTQYLMDSITGLSDFYVMDSAGGLLPFLMFADFYGFKKRSFNDRLKDIKTGHFYINNTGKEAV